MGSSAVNPDQWVDGPAPPASGEWVAGRAPTPPAAPKDTRGVVDRVADWAQGKVQQLAMPVPGDPLQHGFFDSFHNDAIAPVMSMLNDAIDRGDYGAHTAEQLLRGFDSQVKNFAGHPDIRNLPLVGPGATATATQAVKQAYAGNYKGAIGTLAGFIVPLLAPEAAAAMLDKLPAAARAAAEAADVTGRAASAAGAGVKAAAADVAIGATKQAAGMAAAHLIPGAGAVAHLMPGAEFLETLGGGALAEKYLGGLSQMRRGFAKGADAWQAERAAQAAADAKVVSQARIPIWQRPAAEVARQAAEDAAYERLPATPPEWWQPGPPGTPQSWQPPEGATPDQGKPQWAPGTAGTPEPAEQWEPGPAERAPTDTATDRTPDARETVAPELAARAGDIRGETHELTPALTDAQRLEDAIQRHAAYLRMQADDITWANRARKADRYAGYLIKNDLEATPDNLARAAREMGERAAPSDETLPMIEDRLAWHAKRTAAAADEAQAAAPSLADQLEASLEAVKSKRGTETSTESIPEPAPGGRPALDTGATGGRSEAGTPPATLPGAASGDSTEVLIPGQRDTYPATYAVKELADIQPSHLGQTFEPNPRYTLKNDRNYDDPRNQRKIVDWSTQERFQPRNMLNTAPDASSGPPIVDAEGNVLGGNGRSMILDRVYNSPEGGASYRAELDRTAHHYGIDPADYAHMKQPVLVRVAGNIETPENLQRAITQFNKVGTAALTPAERAIADAGGVSERTLDDIAARMDRLGPDATLAQTLEGRQGIEVLRNLERDGVVDPQEGAELATDTKLTRQGKERISGLMLGRFFSDAKQMDALPDALRNKLERMTAPLARAEASAGYSMKPVIKQALDLLEDADAHGATLDDHLQQQGLFGEHEYSPAAVTFAKALKSTNPVELTHAARRYAERARYAKEYQGPGMFNDIAAPLPPRDAFLDSFEHLAK
jgi:ddrB-like ParB superfamily domain